VLKIIRGINNIPSKWAGCVVTIGNFDGVHCGHQQLIANLAQQAALHQLPAVVITFEPQPNEFFAAADAIPARLMRWREKYAVFSALPVDYMLCLSFDRSLALLSAEEFIEKIVVKQLKAAHVVVGDDFHFGYRRSGDIYLLQQQGAHWGFSVSCAPSYYLGQTRVSSSQVRQALQQGDLNLAQQYLGRPYGMFGRVVHGHKRGRTIGFPTANLLLHRRTVPLSGVYVVTARLLRHTEEDLLLQGVANVGTRPTVGGTRSLLEVHLFDFNQDIYGCTLYVTFIQKLRDEERYDSFELLQKQIQKDAQNARDYFAEIKQIDASA